MNPVDYFITALLSLKSRAQHGNVKPVLLQCGSLPPHARVEGYGHIFYNDEDFILHGWDLIALQQFVESGERAKHRRLPPMQRRSLVDQPGRIPTVVKITGVILHMLDGPVGDLHGQR